MRHTELFYLLALQQAEGIGDVTAKKLLAHFGSAEEIFKTSTLKLLRTSGVGTFRMRALQDASLLRHAEAEIRFIENNGIGWSACYDDNYPAKLKHCPDGPVLLFNRGGFDRSKRMLSIVGTRNMTRRGGEFVSELMADLAHFDPVIVSGFAFGVDIAAHRAALSAGLQTVAVVAHGLGQIYPKAHTRYVSEMMESGGFISEFPSGARPEREHFIRRNRIVAGLSEATIVVESAEKGGSLITARYANDYDREVFAVPGRPEDIYSKGCNDLIRTQRAHVLTSAADLIYLLNWSTGQSPKPVQRQLFIDLNDDESPVVDVLKGKGKLLLDDLSLECAMPVSKLSALLLGLEMKGAVRALPGKWFESVM